MLGHFHLQTESKFGTFSLTSHKNKKLLKKVLTMNRKDVKIKNVLARSKDKSTLKNKQ